MGARLTRARAKSRLDGLLARGIADEGDADELAGLIPTALGYDGYCLALGFGFHERARVVDISPEWTATHMSLIEHDPIPPWMMARPAGSVFHIRGRPPAVGNPVYEAFLKTEHGDGIVGMMSSPEGEPLFFVGYRKGQQRRFGAREVGELAALQAPLERALATRTALAAVCDPELSSVIGTIEIDGDRQRWSRSAEKFLASVLEGPLTGTRRTRAEVMARAWVRRLVRGSRSRPLVAGVRIELGVRSPERRGANSYILMLVRDPAHGLPMRGPWEELLGGRQRLVVAAAARGRTNEQIALSLGVSVETVRTHLERAFRILGVANRTELAALIARS